MALSVAVGVAAAGLNAGSVLGAENECAHEEIFTKPPLFEDGFEQVGDVLELLPLDRSRWTHLKTTYKDSRFELTPNYRGRDGTVLRVLGARAQGSVSKASIEREGFDFREGHRVALSAWMFIAGTGSLNNLFIFDLECLTCWSADNVHPNQTPGIRLFLKGTAGYLAVDRGKIGIKHGTFMQARQTRVAFPRDRWVHVEWVLGLSAGEAGYTEVCLDGRKILTGTGPNLIDPNIFARYGVKLNRPVKYDKIELGVTASSSSDPMVMYLDDIRVSAKPAGKAPSQ